MADKKWNGVDRSSFVWNPTIDESKCTNCGLCLLSCGAGVFAFSKTTGKYLVLRPGNCSVGCTTCGRVCPEEAITFPEDSKKFVKAAVVKYKIFPSVKTALDERLEKFPDHIVHESYSRRNRHG